MLNKILTRKMLTIAFLGISSGVPLGVLLTLLQAWTTEAGIDLKTVSLAGLTQLPYTWKFIWSPLMDRYRMPFLGRRRGWMLVSQIAMMAGLVLMGQFNPADDLYLILGIAFFVAFAGASHDIVIDAYRRDVLDDNELGFGSAVATNSYLIGFRYLAAVLGLFLADNVPWSDVLGVMGLICGIGIIGTMIAPEKDGSISIPKSLKDAIILPFKQFLQSRGVLVGLEILFFILIYKIGDNLAQHMLTPFYLKTGYTKTEIALIGKMVGFWCTFAGTFIGGFFLLKYSIRKVLLWFGFFQAFSTLSFVLLAGRAPDLTLFGFVVGFENLTAGMGTAAFSAFMLKLTDRRFSATQFALLSSLMGFPRVVVPSLVGTLAAKLAWENYFILCTFAAIPALLMVYYRSDKWEA